ncbi:MAG: hypothetical protein H6564_12855 [Lewinellaceae bacterium]|nr:hypothetical protein [Lewinellaceae bacterium]
MKARKISSKATGPSHRPFFQKGRGASFFFNKTHGAIAQKDEEGQKKKAEEDNKALLEGVSTVASNLTSQNPAFTKWMEPRLELLKKYAWSSQPLSYKVSMISFGLGNLAILGGVFAADPQFRSQAMGFLQDKNLMAPLGLIPHSEYFPLSSFKYKLPSEDNAAYRFDTQFALTPWYNLLRSRFSYLPQASLSFGLQSAYDPSASSFGVTGGKFSLGLFGGGLSLSGGTFSELPAYPQLIPGSLPGEPPAWLMKQVPGEEPFKLSGQDFRFMLSLDLAKLF